MKSTGHRDFDVHIPSAQGLPFPVIPNGLTKVRILFESGGPSPGNTPLYGSQKPHRNNTLVHLESCAWSSLPIRKERR